jgi:hypothetical protein
VQTKTRTIETATPCPHCGRNLLMRQVGIVLDQGSVVKWADQSRFCPAGCHYTADEVRE